MNLASLHRRARFGRCCTLTALLLALSVSAQPTPATRAPGLATPADVPTLIATLQKTDATTFQKANACQQLAIVGTRDAVPSLAGLLRDPLLAAYARDALEAIPDRAATEALRDALPNLSADLRIGAINSLGVRRDPAAIASLAPLARDPASGFAPAALAALARIASPEALEIVHQTLTATDANLRAHAAEAGLYGAQGEVARGRPDVGAALFDAIRKSDVPPEFRVLATRGSILARGPDGVPLLLSSLRSDEPATRQMAIAVAREVPGTAVSEALAGELSRSSTPLQILILKTLNDRADRSVRGPVESLVASSTPEVRVAALETLGGVGSDSSVPVLLKALADSPTPPEANAAEASLMRLSAGDPDTALLKALPSAAPPARARMIAILGYRGATKATPELLQQAADPNPAVARASFDALAAIAGIRELPDVIRVAVSREDAAIREKAERAVYEIALKQPDATKRSEPLAAAFPSVPTLTGKTALLQVMALLADPPAYRVVSAAAEEGTPEVRDAALRVLVNWPDPTPAPLLLKTFKTTPNDVHRSLALRGLVTLATLWVDQPAGSPGASSRPPAESIAWLTQANAAIRNQPDEKKIVLSGLGDLNCEEGLRLLQPYLDDASVRHDAELAVLRVVKRLQSAAEKRAARPLLEKIVAATTDADARKEAQDALKAIPAGDAAG